MYTNHIKWQSFAYPLVTVTHFYHLLFTSRLTIECTQLDPDSTPLMTMMERYPGDRGNTHIGSLRRYLANFGLGGEVLPSQRIHTMSGGQKCRLCLALAMYRKPHLLILDEPTNRKHTRAFVFCFACFFLLHSRARYLSPCRFVR
jgi:ABC transporter